MWTPKRVVLLASGFVLFCAAYAAYAQVLGGIDGLPTLPEKYIPGKPPGPLPIITRSQVELRLQQAFGEGCAEVKMPIKVESPRGVVIASRDCVFERGGREVRLTPISLACFGKPAPGRDPEINTIRGATATLILDQPINGPLDMGKRRIVAAELRGAPERKSPILIRHYRHNPPPAQDTEIQIQINNGPVYFDDEKHLIQTNDVAELKDFQSKPDPIKVTATGLDVYLTDNVQGGGPAGKGAPPKPKADGTGGAVERIVLRSNVDMHLYNDAGGGFLGLGAGPAKPAAPAPPKPAPRPKDHIWITTAGPFVYDLARNHGRFDVPEKPSQLAAERVTVYRNPNDNRREADREDKLDCEHLELQFRRKTAEGATAGGAPAPAAGDQGPSLEIEWVHAWGSEITIKSAEEYLHARGNDLFYQAPTRTTVLKGEPEAELLKDLDEIHARELKMIDQPDKGPQQVTATGAGSIHLSDKKTGKRVLHARWKEKFVSARDGKQDVLTFTGNAAFAEDEALMPQDVFSDEKLLACKTVLKADELQVWLEPRPPEAPRPAPTAPTAPPPPRPGEAAEAGGGRRPTRVEATGHVVARSPEMHILDRPKQPTERLTILFKDVPEAAAPPSPPDPGPRPGDPPGGPEPIVVPAPTKPEPPAKPARPIELSASTIKAWVLRSGTGKTELDKLQTEGKVHVVQAPSGDDKGFDIKGEKLDLERKPAGNLLKVYDTTDGLAELQMDRLLIVGPEVEINQGDNTATVNGDGCMHMENATDFQGNSLKKPEVLVVHWKKLMRFEGDFAEFHGDIQAQQGTSRLACQTLRVCLDKPVSLKEGAKGPGKGSEPARVQRLLCDRSVKVEEEAYLPNTRTLAGYKSLDCLEMSVVNLERTVRAVGPGVVRIVQPGGGIGTPLGTAGARADKGAAKAAEPQWTLTLVTYGHFDDGLGKNKDAAGWMDADNTKHTATFHQNVQVLHLPWGDNPERLREKVDVVASLERLPPGGLYMECQKLEVYSPEEGPKDGNKEATPGKHKMKATKEVRVKATDAKGQVIWGTAEEVHYDEEKEQVIFNGKDGVAEVFQVERRGAEPKKTVARQIIYWRKTGKVDVDKAMEIRN